ncbi:MAG: peptidoglycan-binding domain-containing protein, partial [Acidimicrobiales bacterium]
EIYEMYKPQVAVINLPAPVEEVSMSYQYSAHEDPPPPPPFRGNDLAQGCADAENTRLVQERLAQLGYLPQAVDGDFGEETDKNVRWYQGNSNLKVDGIVGQYTWASLF